jgi:hypothetical protein
MAQASDEISESSCDDDCSHYRTLSLCTSGRAACGLYALRSAPCPRTTRGLCRLELARLLLTPRCRFPCGLLYISVLQELLHVRSILSRGSIVAFALDGTGFSDVLSRAALTLWPLHVCLHVNSESPLGPPRGFTLAAPPALARTGQSGRRLFAGITKFSLIGRPIAVANTVRLRGFPCRLLAHEQIMHRRAAIGQARQLTKWGVAPAGGLCEMLINALYEAAELEHNLRLAARVSGELELSAAAPPAAPAVVSLASTAVPSPVAATPRQGWTRQLDGRRCFWPTPRVRGFIRTPCQARTPMACTTNRLHGERRAA